MKSYHKPAKQNFAGNKFFDFLQKENKLVKLLDISIFKDMESARGKFSMNNNITGFTKDGGRIWTF